MLGRTADDLYWLSRYIERAENMARLVEAGYRMALMPHEDGGKFDEWRSALESSGSAQSYAAKHEHCDAANVIDHLLFDPDNPSSVYSCLATARQNGRAQRTALTQDMWESLNTTWLEFSRVERGTFSPGELMDLIAYIKQRSALFRGALIGTILRNDTYLFSQLGAFVERADNTARILDVKYYILLPENDVIGGGVDARQWTAILRSVSAHRSYRWVYHEPYRPWRVAEFLILNRQMPRSLAFAYGVVSRALDELAGMHGGRFASNAMAAAANERLTAQSITDIFQEGLHEFLLAFRARNNQLSEQISRDYHFDG
jgi:uncharacterized alpha-E superfamily protein